MEGLCGAPYFLQVNDQSYSLSFKKLPSGLGEGREWKVENCFFACFAIQIQSFYWNILPESLILHYLFLVLTFINHYISVSIDYSYLPIKTCNEDSINLSNFLLMVANSEGAHLFIVWSISVSILSQWNSPWKKELELRSPLSQL